MCQNFISVVLALALESSLLKLQPTCFGVLPPFLSPSPNIFVDLHVLHHVFIMYSQEQNSKGWLTSLSVPTAHQEAFG